MTEAGDQLDHERAKPRRTRRFPVRIIAHDLEHPLNVGGLFRLADALGLQHVHLTGRTPAPPHPKLRRTSRGTEAWVPFEVETDPLRVIERLRTSGFHVAALEITTASVDVRALAGRAPAPLCLVLGAESHGIAAELLAACDAAYHVPMYGRSSSMNVIQAASVALFSAITPWATALDEPSPGGSAVP